MRRKVTFLKIAPATCPVCGQACWLQTGNAELVRQIYPNAKFVCSDCAWTGKAAANQ